MSTCRFARVEEDSIVTYDCNEVRIFYDKWLKEFRKENRTEEWDLLGIKDHPYQRFAEELNSFLEKCKCLDSLYCSKCLPEDHYGGFCRCESRNIAIAKKIRKELDNNPFIIDSRECFINLEGE